MPSEPTRKPPAPPTQQRSTQERRRRERRQSKETREPDRRKALRRGDSGVNNLGEEKAASTPQRREIPAAKLAPEESTQPGASLRPIFHPFDHLSSEVRNEPAVEEAGRRDFDQPGLFPVKSVPNSREEDFAESHRHAFRKRGDRRRNYGLGGGGAAWLVAWLIMLLVLVVAAFLLFIHL